MNYEKKFPQVAKGSKPDNERLKKALSSASYKYHHRSVIDQMKQQAKEKFRNKRGIKEALTEN